MLPCAPVGIVKVGYVANGESRITLEDGRTVSIFHTPDAIIRFGDHVKISADVQFGMPHKPITKLIIGRHTVLYGGLFAPSSLVIGQFVTIHKDVFMFGKSYCVIGHNSWFGMRCTIDCEGEYWEAGNNFGAGQDSHMWSHIAHGDRSMGCKYYDLSRGFSAANDVWLVGRCTSAPLSHSSFSVALTESNLTKHMEHNTVWGGNPAQDLTHRIGNPYLVTAEESREIFSKAVKQFRKDYPKCNVDEFIKDFDLLDRVFYGEPNKDTDLFQIHMLKKEKIKFIPHNKMKVSKDDVD